MSAPLDVIRPRLAKLLPLLGSDKAGEVAATVAAMGRTLKAGGCDWNDLGKLIGDVPVVAVYTPPAYGNTRPAPTQPQPKPQRQPSPWPTFSTLRHSERCAWLEAIKVRSHIMIQKPRAEFEALYSQMVQRPHEVMSRKQVNLFNKRVKMFWIMGVRI